MSKKSGRSFGDKLMKILVVPGIPVAQSRPRFYRRGNSLGVYNKSDTVSFKKQIAIAAKTINVEKIITPICMKILFYFPRPLRHQRKYSIEFAIPKETKPDCDNLAKSCMDALNGIAYNDDAQISKLIVEKFYCEKNDVPRTIIIIDELKMLHMEQ